MAETGTRLAEEHVSTTQHVFTANRNTPSIFKFEDYTEQQIKKIISNLKNTNSCGHDNITTKVVKDSSNKIAPYIQMIVNSTTSTGIFPTQLKLIKVVPILKGGNPEEFGNYRPICIAPVIGKVIEKIVNDQLLEYLENNGIINNQHYGFRNKSNTAQLFLNTCHMSKQNLTTNKL